MQRTLWLAVACAAAVLGTGGCSRDYVRSDEAMLGRIPQQRKQALFTAQNSISVAQANLAAADRGKNEAAAFREVAEHEFDSAKARLTAAQKSIDLGRKSGYQPNIEGGERQLTLAQRQFETFQTKKEYADRLLDLRERELEAARKRNEIAQLDLAIARADTIRRAGMQPQENLSELRSKKNDKLAELAGIDKRRDLLREEVAELRSTWNDKRRAYNVASRGVPQAPDIPPPPPPRPVEPSYP